MSEFILEKIEKELDKKIKMNLQKTGKDIVELWENILSWYNDGGVENVKRQILALIDKILKEKEDEEEVEER